MKKFLFIIIVLLLVGMGYAQDPGIPDTVRLGDWGVYLPCPPCSGIATVPVYVFHDEYITEMTFYFKSSGPVKFLDIQYTAVIDSHFITKDKYTFDNVGHIRLVTFDSLALPPNLTYIAYFVLLVTDTGAACIDSYAPNAPPDPPLVMTSDQDDIIAPFFIKSQVHLNEQSIKPGEVYVDGKVNIGDIIFFVNYIFKNGPEPPNRQMADVNVDCVLDLRDLKCLVSYIFKGGQKPLPGCAN